MHRQVLANILSNAVKFTEKGEVVVEGHVEAAPDPELAAGRSMFHLSVRDTGIGISQESMAKLFQCFRQGHESMTRKYGGTGGLTRWGGEGGVAPRDKGEGRGS